MTEQELLRDLSRAKTAFKRTAARGRKEDKIVEKWVQEQLDRDTTKLIAQATADLYSGPHSERGYPGFESAMRSIADDFNDLPSRVWVDTQAGFVQETEPEGWEDEEGEWVEPFWEDYVEYDRSDIQRAALGELASYV